MKTINSHTIGFTKKTAERFFTLLNDNNVKTIIDTRLNNSSQLSGFAKEKDLRFFLKKICKIEYVYLPELAPEKKFLNDYKNKVITWDEYAIEYVNLMEKRLVSKKINPLDINDGCFLCSEDKPHYCHRRLLAEYLKQQWSIENINMDINHIV